MTVITKIICENISYFHPIAIILGNDPLETKKDLSDDRVKESDEEENSTEEEINNFDISEDPESKLQTKIHKVEENIKTKINDK